MYSTFCVDKLSLSKQFSEVILSVPNWFDVDILSMSNLNLLSVCACVLFSVGLVSNRFNAGISSVSNRFNVGILSASTRFGVCIMWSVSNQFVDILSVSDRFGVDILPLSIRFSVGILSSVSNRFSADILAWIYCQCLIGLVWIYRLCLICLSASGRFNVMNI